MSKLSRIQTLAPALATLLALSVPGGPALAAPDTSSWKCERCPFEKGYTADTEVGATNVGDDAFRHGNFTGYDESGVYPNLDGQGRYAGDGYQLKWMAEDLGLDSRVFGVEGGRQGTFGFDLGYQEIPERVFDTTVTPYVRSGDSLLTLPSGWVDAFSTDGMTALPGALRGQNIESDRQILTVGGEYLPSPRLRLFADYRRQEQDGTAGGQGEGRPRAARHAPARPQQRGEHEGQGGDRRGGRDAGPGLDADSQRDVRSRPAEQQQREGQGRDRTHEWPGRASFADQPEQQSRAPAQQEGLEHDRRQRGDEPAGHQHRIAAMCEHRHRPDDRDAQHREQEAGPGAGREPAGRGRRRVPPGLRIHPRAMVARAWNPAPASDRKRPCGARSWR